MLVESGKLVSAYHVPPGNTSYIVILPLESTTLKEGDVGKVISWKGELIFIRQDNTLHTIVDDDQYIILMKLDTDTPILQYLEVYGPSYVHRDPTPEEVVEWGKKNEKQ